MTGREMALLVLCETEREASYLDLALKKALKTARLSREDRAFTTELAYGTMRYRLRLDYIIKKFSKLPLRKLSLPILNILRLSLYQLVFLPNIPQAAVVSEGVSLAKRYGHGASAGFVNGVLRSFQRDGISYPNDPLENLSVYYAFPKWLAARILQAYGYDEGKRICKAFNERPDVTFRTNLTKATPEQLKARLEEEGVTVTAVNGALLTVEKTGEIGVLRSFREGLFTVQDLAAYAAGSALAPREGEKVLDVCAAPGGKTTHLAELSQDKAEIFAFDLHPHKVEIIEKNAARLGLTSVKAQVHDAKELLPEWEGRADRVLADVPCSGLGILRKKPDIKWRKQEEEIALLAKEQLAILETSSRYLKKGGRMVYATCTITEEENSGVIQSFLRVHKGFRLLSEKQYLPHTDHTDGFYIAALERE